MSLLISKVFTYDVDAGNYIQAVEAEDAQALEPATRQAINNFVIGCKQDGIWTAIKASCILAGARTLAGALVPLAGTAPTNFNFVSGDYNRKTGLVGDGATKYLNSSRDNAADPSLSRHLAAYCAGQWVESNGRYFMGLGNNTTNGESYTRSINAGTIYAKCYSSANIVATWLRSAGLLAVQRKASTKIELRADRSTVEFSDAFFPASGGSVIVFATAIPGTGEPSSSSFINARLAFYSIGESLDLALLDARVTALINAFAAAIP